MTPALDLDLPAIALAHLSARGATRTGPHADAQATATLLTDRGYPAHPAVLAFETAYGGLQLFESDPALVVLAVGPYACFTAQPKYTGRPREVVPVMFACNDVYYALDLEGRGYTNAAMVEGVWRPSAPNGRSLLTQAVLWRALETHPASYTFQEGRRGAAMAKERSLQPIADATGETERWWADDKRLVVETDRGNGYEGPMTYATK
jgi:hypothetical protein